MEGQEELMLKFKKVLQTIKTRMLVLLLTLNYNIRTQLVRIKNNLKSLLFLNQTESTRTMLQLISKKVLKIQGGQ